METRSHERGIFLQMLTMLILLILFTSSPVYARNILVGGTGYWTPYCYTTKSSPECLKGFTVDILNTIFKDSGDKIRFICMSWRRCIKMLDHGQLDLVMDGSKDSPKLRKYLFSDQIYKLDNVFLYSKKKYPSGPVIKNTSDIEKYSIGGMQGFSYKIYPFPESRVQQRALDVKAMIDMILYERFDLGVGFKQIVLSNAKMNGYSLNDIGHVQIPEMEPLRFYIFGNPFDRTEKLINRINRGLAEMKRNGDLDALRKKYGLPSK